MDSQERKIVNGYGIFSLWLNWVLGVGALMIILFISPMIDKVWLPLITFTLELLLFSLVRHNRYAQIPVCSLIPFICTRILFWTAVVMVLINLLYIDDFIYNFFEPKSLNDDIPFISVLIIAPITTIVTSWVYIRKRKINFCIDCVFRHGSSAERGFLGKLFSQEGIYQTRMLLLLSLLLTVTVWLYYFVFYINVNINMPDKFFFIILPIIFFLLSTIYLGIRYAGMWSYYNQEVQNNPLKHGNSTTMRFIIFHQENIFLSQNTEKDKDGVIDNAFDTPAIVEISYRDRIADYEAEAYFTDVSGFTDVDMRLMYTNTDLNTKCSIYHYACFVNDTSIVEKSKLNGKWYSHAQLSNMLNYNQVSHILSAEYSRVYRIVMARKTYDRNGLRLYNIKNYKPSFRLSDLKNWSVDLNDTEWLYISINNEDKPFFQLKRFWRKYVNGIGK